MAKRPVFIANTSDQYLVKTQLIEFKYHSGFSISQKQKCILELHNSIKDTFKNAKILEISSKSEIFLGVQLSAFNLMIRDQKRNKSYSVECAFQAGKIFEKAGPFLDILDKSSLEAKRDERLKNSGNLIGFSFFGTSWPLTPLTAFYDWLYINAIRVRTEFHEELLEYDFFTDIEFNPEKSINCQACSVAMFVSLHKRNLLDSIKDPKTFLQLYSEYKIENTSSQNKTINLQATLLN